MVVYGCTNGDTAQQEWWIQTKRLYQATMNYINNSSKMIIFEKSLSQPKLKAHSHDSKSNKSSNESWRTNHHPKKSGKERTIKKARPLNQVYGHLPRDKQSNKTPSSNHPPPETTCNSCTPWAWGDGSIDGTVFVINVFSCVQWIFVQVLTDATGGWSGAYYIPRQCNTIRH